ncbi:MAG: hypothetical protein KBF66_13520 [Rhodoferax sp.]|uniref:hypothetical protein n=1 Tax=Rhodoferax sp. TaxID=50421 RepID=UPI001B4C64D6|nr:hypothetical protein [Rhodoferax sp.]MBP9906575.1 hypothetical protein [Rhodoferax sp.]
MIRRCTKPRHHDWRWYGGKGITVCREWLESFDTFLRDVGTAPSPQHWLGRLDVLGNYQPGNVEWIDHDTQVRRRAWCKKIDIDGQQLTIAEAERAVGLEDGTLRQRLKAGHQLADALTRKPSRTGRPPKIHNQPTPKETHDRT